MLSKCILYCEESPIASCRNAVYLASVLLLKYDLQNSATAGLKITVHTTACVQDSKRCISKTTSHFQILSTSNIPTCDNKL